MLEFVEKLSGPGETDEVVALPFELRQRSRQRVVLASGRDAGIVLNPGTTMANGDRLRSADGITVLVTAAAESVSTATTPDALLLARASYHLGNRHVKLQVGDGWVRYQPDHVLDEMLRRLGLNVVHEQALFDPERGAYHGRKTHNDDHGHEH